MDRALILETLPPEQRLALVYAPAWRRDGLLAVLGLDLRLAQVVLGAREPMLAQIRLAWWRDRLADDAAVIEGEPLLQLVQDAVLDRAPLRDLVDGWEGLLGEPAPELAKSLAHTRAEAISYAASRTPVDHAVLTSAREWSLQDLSRIPGPWGILAGKLANAEQWQARRLPREQRFLAVLHALARRSRRSGATGPGPGSIVVALRVGLFGR